jgi:hypothetical protein
MSFKEVSDLPELTSCHSNAASNTSNSRGPDLRCFDPLCSPDEEMLQMETELINKVRGFEIKGVLMYKILFKKFSNLLETVA